MKQPKRETLYISKEGDITIIKVTSIPDASYSIYYKNTCESKGITEENFQLISGVLQNDKNILNYVEDTKTNGNTKSVLEILLDMISEQLKPKVEQVSLGGFDSFFDRSTKELDINNFTQGLKKMEEDMNQNLRKVEFDSSMKISEEYLKTLGDKFSLKNLPPIGSGKFLEDIKIEPELDQIKRDPLESGTKSVPKEAETKDGDRMTLKVEYFENKNPKTFGFNGIAGMKDLKDELTNSFLKPLKFKFTVEGKLSDLKGDKKKEKQYRLIYDQYEKFKISIPTGLLFYGPPGTGKTFITKKLAQELGAGLIVKSLGEFGSSYLHQTTVNIKNFFDDAKKASEKGPIILFLDEIDSLLSKRTNSIDANKAEEVSQFLQEFNKLEEAPNLVVIAATNRPDHLDPAILRSGRLDKKIYIGPPDYIARKELFEMYIEKAERPHDKLDYEELAKLTEGYVAADIEAMCDEVSRDAGKNLLELMDQVGSKKGLSDKKLLESLNGQKITMDLVKRAITDTHSSLKTTDMTIYEEWLKNIEK